MRPLRSLVPNAHDTAESEALISHGEDVYRRPWTAQTELSLDRNSVDEAMSRRETAKIYGLTVERTGPFR